MDFLLVCQRMAEGFLTTLLIFSLTLVISLPMGLLVYFGRASKWAPFSFLAIKKDKSKSNFVKSLSEFKPISMVMKFFIAILRGTPLMLQLIVVYYGPYYVFGAKLTPEWNFIALIVGFAVNYSAYFAEIYRSGIESIPIGQYEAAQVLGYSSAQTFFKIILPQMVKIILPSVTNEIITLVKDTSMAFVLSYIEMFTLAKMIAAKESNIYPLLIAGVFYFVFNYVVDVVMRKVEKSLKYYD